MSAMDVADAQAACVIDDHYLGNNWTDVNFTASLTTDHGLGFVLKSAASEVLGFALYSTVLDEASLLNFGIAVTHRRKGLGLKLLKESLQALLERGVTGVHLEVRESNDAARMLYESVGFIEMGLRKNYYPTIDGHEHAVLMSILWLETTEYC